MAQDQSGLSGPLPHDKDAEKAVLGCMLIDSDAAAVVFDMLDFTVFHEEANKKIFQAGKAVNDRGEPVDVLTVSNELEKAGQLDDIGGDYYLTELIERIPSTANIEHYCKMVADKAAARKLYYLSEDIKKEIGQGEPPDFESIRDRLAKIESGAVTQAATLKNRTFNDYENEMTNEPPALETGFSDLDEIAKIPASALTIIAGRPSHGKTTFLLNLMMQQTRLNPDKMFFFFSYEQTFTQLMTLLLMRESQLILNSKQNFSEYSKYIKGKEAGHLEIDAAKEHLQTLTESNRFWIFDTKYNIDKLAGMIRQLAGVYPIGAVYIDYIQKIGAAVKSYSRQTELQGISGKIQDTANQLKIPIILGAQFSREGERSARSRGQEGKKTDRQKAITEDYIREAGDIEQDATLILSLWDDIKAGGNDPNLTVTVLKGRYGATGEQKFLKYNRPVCTIQDLDAPDEPKEIKKTSHIDFLTSKQR